MDTRHVDWVSHKDYLDSCDYDDLINLKGFLEKRIQDITSEKKVEIYGVKGPSIYEGWYETYEDAYEVFVERVVPKLEKEYYVDENVGIESKKIFKSQIKEYIPRLRTFK